MWELTTESLLFSLIYPCALCAVVLDPAESLLFVGGTDGKIFQSILYSDLFVTRTRSYESGLPTEDKIEELVYHGHSQAVTCLSLSLDASLLVSASEDGTLIVWDVQCRQQLRTFNKHGGFFFNTIFFFFAKTFFLAGPVTNLLLLTKPTTLFTEKFDYCVPPISPLNRYKSAMAASVPVVIPPFRSSFYVDDGANKGLLPAIRPSFLDDSDETKRNLQEKILSLSAKTDSLETELARVKSLNSELFARLLRSGGCPI
ncbi:WD repeat-containing protein 18-like [Zophobas morio]